MVVPFSFIFKSLALQKYPSALSLSNSSRFLILQFLVKRCKLHSVFKILPKSHMLEYFQLQVCPTNIHIKYDLILLKSLNSPNLYINWANMWYPDYQNKKLNLCMLNSFKGFHLCIKEAIMWYPDNQLRKKLNSCNSIKQLMTYQNSLRNIYLLSLLLINSLFLISATK